MSGYLIAQQLINGVVAGTLYCLIAIGLTQIYGVLGISHFAHGSVVMVAGYISYTIARLLGFPWVVAGVVTILFCMLLGMLIERFFYRPVMKGPAINIFIIALGLMFIFENLTQVIWGTDKVSIILKDNVSINMGSVSITTYKVYLIVITAILIAALLIIMKRTKMGRSIRAVAMNKEAAAIVGVNVNGTYRLVFAIGSALAGLCGLFLVTVGSVDPPTGGYIIVKGFAVMILGGMGSIPGVVVGSLIMGLIEAFGGMLLGTAFKDAYGFIIIILVLVFKPSGLFGKSKSK